MNRSRKDANALLPTWLHDNLVRDLLSIVPDTERLKYLQQEFLSKYVDKDSPVNARERRAAAITKWLSVERRNEKTNNRLWNSEVFFRGCRKANKDGITTLFSSEHVLSVASKIIVKIIGEEPDLDQMLGSFSNGASTSKRKLPGVVARKYAEKADVTYACWLRTIGWFRQFETWHTLTGDSCIEGCRIVPGNVLFTVPKNSEIDRVAAKEPDLNMFAQRAVGDFFRDRLRRKAGIDLNDQSRNRNLARQWKVFATIDLSSASDTVTTALVCRLLPLKWFQLLDDLRSRYTSYRGKYRENAMFSSMGNGFTFELESLIFFSLVKAIAILSRMEDKRVSVYGDDIICHKNLAPTVIQCFHFFGFKANREKSHWTGGFRESCGGHYLYGSDITPIYLKSKIERLSDLIHVLNRLRKWLNIEPFRSSHRDVYLVWLKYSQYVPKSLRGGWLFDKYSLVSLDKPKLRLAPNKRRLQRLEQTLAAGLYLSSLRALVDRDSSTADDATPGIYQELSTFRLRKVDVDHWHSFGLRTGALFYEEFPDVH